MFFMKTRLMSPAEKKMQATRADAKNRVAEGIQVIRQERVMKRTFPMGLDESFSARIMEILVAAGIEHDVAKTMSEVKISYEDNKFFRAAFTKDLLNDKILSILLAKIASPEDYSGAFYSFRTPSRDIEAGIKKISSTQDKQELVLGAITLLNKNSKAIIDNFLEHEEKENNSLMSFILKPISIISKIVIKILYPESEYSQDLSQKVNKLLDSAENKIKQRSETKSVETFHNKVPKPIPTPVSTRHGTKPRDSSSSSSRSR